MKLLVNGIEATVGMEVTTFRGEKFILTGWREPKQPFGGMNGKVYCQSPSQYRNKDFYVCEWYPQVINAKFVESEVE